MTTSRHLVDPELIDLIDSRPTVSLDDELLQVMRANPLPLPPASAEATAAIAIERRTVPGPEGAPPVGVVLYRPHAATGMLGCILHIHGGGYVAGSTAAIEGVHIELAHTLGCVIVTVDYRLAPETCFPGNLEDCYAALAWTFAEAEALGIDPARIGVMGESAGGGLAAALALLARDRGDYALAFQHLIYPMLDDRTGTQGDPNPFAGDYVWNATSNRFGWRSLLGREPGGDDVSPYAAPARAADLAGLPRTFIGTAALDLFIDEDLDYARRLIRAGVPTELHVYPGAFHAFDFISNSAVSLRARAESVAALRRAIG